MAKDYYGILGVEKNASKDEIKKAFRKLAQKHHPDKPDGDQEKFKEINEAYNVLTDDTKRQQYDRFGEAGPQAGAGQGGGFGGFGDFSDFAEQFGGGRAQGGAGFQDFDLGDIFGEFFGGGGGGRRTRRGNDIAVDMDLSFEDAVFGTSRNVTLNKQSSCDRCNGDGAEPGAGTETCSTCQGKGKVEEVKQSFIGSFRSVHACQSCHGSGSIPKTKCGKCAGDGVVKQETTHEITVPPGIEDGQMIRMTGGGEAVAGGQPGDLYIKIHVKPHERIRKEGEHLYTDVAVKLSDALLGATYKIETLDGTVDLKIPAGVTQGELLRLKGKGVPMDRNSSKRGDLFAKVKLQMPSKLSKKAKEAVKTLKEEGY